MRLRCLLLTCVCTLSLTWNLPGQQPPSLPSAEPNPEITQQKLQSLDEKLKDLEELKVKLKDLGKPTEKMEGESTEQYLERVERIFKGRAYYLILIGQEVKDALKAKWEAEGAVEEYKQWIKNLEKRFPNLFTKYEKKRAGLTKDVEELARDLVVLASITHAQATKEAAAAPDEKKKRLEEQAKQLEKEFSPQTLADIQDRQSREQKFQPLTTVEDKVKKYNDLLRDYNKKLWRRDLWMTASAETGALRNVLTDAHVQALKALESTLTDNQEIVGLEDEAEKLSDLADYVNDTLSLVPPEGLKKTTSITRADVLNRLPSINAGIGTIMEAIGTPAPTIRQSLSPVQMLSPRTPPAIPNTKLKEKSGL